jgi:hypothetical protein
MRIINIIESTVETPILSIESFGIFEEQLSDEVAKQAEKLFRAKAIENGALEDEIEDAIENGYFAKGGYTVSIVWSEI